MLSVNNDISYKFLSFVFLWFERPVRAVWNHIIIARINCKTFLRKQENQEESGTEK